MTGEKSQFPLTRLASAYRKMQSDGRILSNRKAIEVMDYRIVELLERIDANEAPERFLRLQRLWRKFAKERLTGDTLETLKLQKQLDAEFEAAYHDYMAWKQMFEALDLRKGLVESEVKIAKDLKAILTAEDAYQMMAKIFAVVIEIEEDPKKLKRYEYEFTRIVGDGKVVDAERVAEVEAEDDARD